MTAPIQQTEELKEEAAKKITERHFAFRSCWNCNTAHEYLKNANYVINCFGCGRWFYKGVDITSDNEAEPTQLISEDTGIGLIAMFV